MEGLRRLVQDRWAENIWPSSAGVGVGCGGGASMFTAVTGNKRAHAAVCADVEEPDKQPGLCFIWTSVCRWRNVGEGGGRWGRWVGARGGDGVWGFRNLQSNSITLSGAD